ncbi:uncharacterized protein LOC123439895 isoform X2 [Hordeum vulgare subsp. vulgare]|uniref:uncharacterized protein LOC123439895 isoform X2 n=1 Tax=Hordeum vulgare subsp. vulgare TaxID=112509 RepID=UPI001D1A4072|nr:uncharacterized protein LOC123439895 isoform X2 [Hordeum vulgare subsp. vulgare]
MSLRRSFMSRFRSLPHRGLRTANVELASVLIPIVAASRTPRCRCGGCFCPGSGHCRIQDSASPLRSEVTATVSLPAPVPLSTRRLLGNKYAFTWSSCCKMKGRENRDDEGRRPARARSQLYYSICHFKRWSISWKLERDPLLNDKSTILVSMGFY